MTGAGSGIPGAVRSAAILGGAAVLLLLGAAGESRSQPVPNAPNAPARNAQERRLEFAEARIGYEDAERRLARARELHENGLISEADLDTQETGLRLAEVQMRRAWTRLALADPEIILRSAKKFQGEDGGVRVELDLIARWTLGLETNAAKAADSGVGQPLDLPVIDGVSNVVISLKTTRGYQEGVLIDPTIISVPYEQRVPLMPFDEPVAVTFGLLLPDVQEVLVELRYNDEVHLRQVLLGKDVDAGGGLVMRSEQVTLDVELGQEAAYDLSLERFDDRSAIYSVTAEGLPPEISFKASDPDSGASFSQVFFPEQVMDRKLRLALTMPSRPTEAVQPGRAIRFAVRLDPEDAAGGARGSTPAGRLELAVVPRGVAELEVEAANLYHEVARGDSVRLDIRVVNSGSGNLEQVELRVNAPFEWSTEVSPQLFPSLEPGTEETAVVVLIPPPDIVVGDYEASIQAGSLSGDQLVESVPKTFRVHVAATSNPWLVAVLAAAVVGAVAGVTWAGLRLSRR